MEYNGIKVLVSEGAFKEYKNEKLKDIMEYLEDPDIYIEDFGYCYKRISLDETNILLDYITDLEQRIDKVIEYIRINKCNNDDISDCWHEDFKDILKILKGEE